MMMQENAKAIEERSSIDDALRRANKVRVYLLSNHTKSSSNSST